MALHGIPMRIAMAFVVLSMLFVSGCTTNGGSPPLVVSSHTPVQLPRERGYVACVTALHQRYSVLDRLRLRPGYRLRILEEQNLQEFHVEGDLHEHGQPTDVYFICHTERYGRTRVLGLERVKRALVTN
jgi:hypothetical protein